MRLGELARGVVAAAELKVPTLSVLATIVVERLCDTAALLTLFTLSAFLLPEVISVQVRNGSLLAAVAVAAGLVVITLGGGWFKTSSWFKRLERFPAAAKFVGELIDGSQGLRSFRVAAGVVLLSFSLWLCDATLFWITARAMGFSPDLSYLYSVVTLASAAAASALPAVPGAFGNFEAAVKQILVHFGYAKPLAVSFAAFVHLVTYIVFTVLGLAFFYRLGYTFSGLRETLRRRES